MRLDLLLVRLRFCKTRSLARKLIEDGHMRLNGQRVVQVSREIEISDILTLPLGKSVLVTQILALPERRGPSAEAQTCYRTLDPADESAIAGATRPEFKGKSLP